MVELKENLKTIYVVHCPFFIDKEILKSELN